MMQLLDPWNLDGHLDRHLDPCVRWCTVPEREVADLVGFSPVPTGATVLLPETGATTSSLAQSSPSGQDSTTFWVGSSAQTTAGHKIYKPNQKQRSWRSHSFETRKIPRPCALPQQLLKVIIAASWMSIPSLRVFIQCHKSLSWVDFLCPKSIPQLLSVRSACWFCNPCWVWTLPKLLQEGSFTACSQPRTLCQSWVSPNIPIPLTP